MPIAVITGGSSGIGLATAELLKAKNWQVYELSRSGCHKENICHIDCDLTDSNAIKAAFAQIEQSNSQIDLLVNNAGMGIAGATELMEEEEVRRMLDIDLIAPWLCMKAALPLLRKAQGRIINISSVAAVFALPYQSFYSAAKAAINSLTQAMAIELAGTGVTITALMPGDIKTSFTDARIKKAAADPIYGQRANRSLAVMEKDEQNGMPPQKPAAKILALAGKKHPKPLYTCGIKYKFFLFLGKILPCGLINKIVAVMYKG